MPHKTDIATNFAADNKSTTEYSIQQLLIVTFIISEL